MKRIIFVCSLCVYINFSSFSQSHQDTIRLLQQAASLYDLDFSEAKSDSLRGHVNFEKNIYQRDAHGAAGK